MDLCNRLLSKAPISWTDLQKQLMIVLQTRGAGSAGGSGGGGGGGLASSVVSGGSSSSGATGQSALSTASLTVNKLLVKQCTDLLVKHIKSNLLHHLFIIIMSTRLVNSSLLSSLGRQILTRIK